MTKVHNAPDVNLHNAEDPEAGEKSKESELVLLQRVLRASPVSQIHLVITFCTSISGFLFGYSTASMSAGLLLTTDTFLLSYTWQNLVVGVLVLGAILCSFAAAPLNQLLGSRIVILLSSAIYALGCLWMACADGRSIFLVGRLLLGLAIGLTTATCTMYISECSPPSVRGRLTVWYQFSITLGMLAAVLIAAIINKAGKRYWRVLFGLPIIPAAIQFVGMMFLPESPRWLLMKGRPEKAQQIFEWIHKQTEAEAIEGPPQENFAQMQQEAITEKNEEPFFDDTELIKEREEEERRREQRRIEKARRAEERKLEKARKAEEARLAKEKEAEEKRIFATLNDDEKKEFLVRKAEEKKLAKVRMAEEAKLEKERKAEAMRVAKEKKAERKKLAKEKREEEAKLAKEKREADEKLAKSKKGEAAAARERRMEEAKLAKARKEQEKKLAKEKKAEAAKLAKEKREEAEKLEQQKKEAARLEKERKAEEAKLAKEKKAEEAKLAREKKEQERAAKLAEKNASNVNESNADDPEEGQPQSQSEPEPEPQPEPEPEPQPEPKVQSEPKVPSEVKAVVPAVKVEKGGKKKKEPKKPSAPSVPIAQRTPFMRMLVSPSARRALILGSFLQMWQQLSGINIIVFYSTTIINMAGVELQSTAMWLSVILMLVNVVSTVITFFIVDRYGRRVLTLVSLAGAFVGLILAAISFAMITSSSPPTNKLGMVPQRMRGDTCRDEKYCNTCVKRSDCGYCYFPPSVGSDEVVVNASCLKTEKFRGVKSLYGPCRRSGSYRSYKWHYNYCPTKPGYSAFSLFSMFFFVCAFAIGMGPTPWTINSEIFPQWGRSIGMAMTSGVNWIFNFLITFTFHYVSNVIGREGVFFLYAFSTLIGFVIFCFILPETKGKRLEEIPHLFAQPWRFKIKIIYG